MSYKRAAIMFVIAFLMQLSLVNLISFFGVVPNLILCLVLILTFLYDDGIKVLWFAIISGILLDMVTMPYIGVSSLGYVLATLLVLFVRKGITIDSILSPIVVAAGGTLVFDIFRYIALKFFGSQAGVLYFMKYEVVCIILNIIVGIIIYLLNVRRAIWYNRDR